MEHDKYVTDFPKLKTVNNLFLFYVADCRDFDFKNCTLLGGRIDVNRNCYLKSDINDSFWNELDGLYNSSRLPADEYFQYKIYLFSSF